MGNATILHVDWRFQHIVLSEHFLLDACDAFTNNGITHLPLRARGTLWRPPSGHFFPSLNSIYPSQSAIFGLTCPFGFHLKSVLFPNHPSGSSPVARMSYYGVDNMVGNAPYVGKRYTLSPDVVEAKIRIRLHKQRQQTYLYPNLPYTGKTRQSS